jgi:excinuclease ABC subunit A
VVVIKHNLDVIKTADWILNLDPEGGLRGGEIVAQGTPEQVAPEPRSYTGQYLNGMLAKASTQVTPPKKAGRVGRRRSRHQAASVRIKIRRRDRHGLNVAVRYAVQRVA